MRAAAHRESRVVLQRAVVVRVDGLEDQPDQPVKPEKTHDLLRAGMKTQLQKTQLQETQLQDS